MKLYAIVCGYGTYLTEAAVDTPFNRETYNWGSNLDRAALFPSATAALAALVSYSNRAGLGGYHFATAAVLPDYTFPEVSVTTATVRTLV